jgi:hypothetical protein
MIVKFLQSPDDDRQRIGFPSVTTERSVEYCAAPQSIETDSMQEVSIVFAGHLSEQDYELARFVMPELRTFHDYEDWLDFRHGSLWGLGMAGFKVEIISVSLRVFEEWCRTTSTPPSICALDRFACAHAHRVVNEQRDEAPFCLAARSSSRLVASSKA